MKIYEVKNASGKTVNFARSFDQARAVVREDNPTAKKIHSNAEMTEFSSCFCIYGIDIKPDKEGILSKLNSLLVEMGDRSPAEPDTGTWDIGDPVMAEPIHEPEPRPEPEPEPYSIGGISPAIEYKGKGQGTCLHCNKTVGYVGGFPQVNPPDAIRDQ